MTQITPDQNESEERFTIRAHRQLMASIPNPSERNKTVWDSWNQHRGPSEADEMASEKFPAERFTASHNHCHFVEHETVTADGEPRKYSLRELVKITRNCNDRILDRESFSAISQDHTPDDPHGDDPPVLGFGGPWRLGMVGRKRPTWAIFGNEHHYNGEQNNLSRRPRRSVELIRFSNTGQMFFEPIAALGAKAPRLAMPTKYTNGEFQGAEVTRYSVVAPASSPGGGNTFIKTPAKFGVDSMDQVQDETIAQIAEAFSRTPEIQWIRKKMQEEQGGQEEGMEGGGGGDEYMADAATPNDQEMQVPPDQTMPPADKDQYSAEEEMPAQADDDTADVEDLLVDDSEEEMKKKQYAAAGEGVSVEKFTALQQSHKTLQGSHNKLVQEHGRLLKQTQKLHIQKQDAERRVEIDKLAARFPGFIDPTEEYQACLGGNGSAQSDEQFVDYLAKIEKFALRAEPVSQRLPTGQFANTDFETEKNAEALSNKAVEIHTTAVNAGKTPTWEDSLGKAREALATTT